MKKEIKKKTKIININNILIGKKNFSIIAGPCSLESYEQIKKIIDICIKNKIKLIRCGIFKLRTNPHDFQGLKEKSIEILKEIKKNNNISIVSEITKIEEIKMLNEVIDIFQIGARNMYNYPLITELAKTKKTIILKRAFCATIREFILASEYILKENNNNIIMCERGIRTFETCTRNTLDLSSIPIIKKETKLPIIVDPSHGTGRKDIILPMCLASIACGADGIMLEIHEKPELALSDSAQSLNFSEFEKIINKIKKTASFFKKKLN